MFFVTLIRGFHRVTLIDLGNFVLHNAFVSVTAIRELIVSTQVVSTQVLAYE